MPGKDATSSNSGHTTTLRYTQIPSGLRMFANYTQSALDAQSENLCWVIVIEEMGEMPCIVWYITAVVAFPTILMLADVYKGWK